MASATVITDLKNQIMLGTHHFGTDVYKLCFFAAANAPSAGNSTYATLPATKVATTNINDPVVSLSESAGNVTCSPTALTATGAFGPFRYYVLYNFTNANQYTVAIYDHGSEVSLISGESFTIRWASSAGAGSIIALT